MLYCLNFLPIMPHTNAYYACVSIWTTKRKSTLVIPSVNCTNFLGRDFGLMLGIYLICYKLQDVDSRCHQRAKQLLVRLHLPLVRLCLPLLPRFRRRLFALCAANALLMGTTKRFFCDGICQKWSHRYCVGVPSSHFEALSSSDKPFLCYLLPVRSGGANV